MSKPSDLVQGTLDLLVLKILALETMNGFAISLRLKQVSGDVLQVSDGSLYPALHKMENEGWIQAEWKITENNRRAKFYSLTRIGRRKLEQESSQWRRISEAITRVSSYGRRDAGNSLQNTYAPSGPLPSPSCRTRFRRRTARPYRTAYGTESRVRHDARRRAPGRPTRPGRH